MLDAKEVDPVHPRPSRQVSGFERRLHRWVREGLITEEAAGAIWAFEREPTPQRPRRGRMAQTGRVPVSAEVLGYLGAALAASAAAVFVSRSWDDLSQAGRLAVPGLGAVVCLLAGLAIHRSTEPAVERLADALWLLTAAGAGWFAGILAADVADVSDRAVVLSIGGAVTVAGGALYWFRPWPLQQLALVAGLGILLGGAFFDHEVAIGVSLTVLGAGWAALGALRLLPPAAAAMVTGSLLAMWGPAIGMDEWVGGATLMGVATAAGVLTLGALRREGVVLGMGVVGLFLYLTRAITYFLRGSAATTLGFLVIGVALMAAAVITIRRRPRRGPPPGIAHG